MDAAVQQQNMDQLQKLADKHGPEILERIRTMILKRAESFPDRDRHVVWIINVSEDGRDITLDVRP
jgi:hypothetical protein